MEFTISPTFLHFIISKEVNLMPKDFSIATINWM